MVSRHHDGRNGIQVNNVNDRGADHAYWPEPPAWTEDASCASTDPEAFFPEKGGSTREAKNICRRCPVQVECLDYALGNEERYGIWGGVSERDRRRISGRPIRPDDTDFDQQEPA